MLSVSSEQRGLNDSLSAPSSNAPSNNALSNNVPLNEPLTRLAGAFKSASGALGEVLMPRTCPCCAVPVAYGSGSPLCEQCLPQLRSALARVERVQVLQPLEGAAAPEVRAASRYVGMMPRALLALKNAGRTDLLPLLGEGLARSVYELLRDHREELQNAPGSSISSVGTSAAPVEVLLIPAPSSAYLLVWCLLVCLLSSVLLRQRASRRAWGLWAVPSGCTVLCASWSLPCARGGSALFVMMW